MRSLIERENEATKDDEWRTKAHEKRAKLQRGMTGF